MISIKTYHRLALVTLACIVAAVVSQTAVGDESQRLTLADFEKLHTELSTAREAWQSIPWNVSILEAQAEAAREKKPIYMLVRSGHPLGCVWNNGIADRASAFQDPLILDVISTWFVPVAVDQHIHRRLQDAEGELFAHVLRQAGRGLGGRSQGVYLFSPDGELLGFSNTADASRVRRLLATALEEFNPAGVATTDEPVEDQPAARPLPEPPAGGLVIDVTSKVLGGYEPDAAERFVNSLGRDHLWLRADEVQAVASGTVPDSVARRIARYHLVDNTRGEPPMWSDSEVKHVELNVHAGRLTGTVHLETETGDRGYQADLLGFVETAGGQITRFDLLAKGQFWGHGRYTRGAPEGKFPLAIAFSLNDGNTPADRVPPQGARRGVNAYLR